MNNLVLCCVRESFPSHSLQNKTSTGNVAVVKRVEELEIALKKQEEEKLQLKQENASLVSSVSCREFLVCS